MRRGILLSSVFFLTLLPRSLLHAGEAAKERAPKISVDAHDLPLHVLVERIRTRTGKTILLGMNREGGDLAGDDSVRVTIRFDEMDWKHALVLVAWQAGAHVERIDDEVLRVYQQPRSPMFDLKTLPGYRRLSSGPHGEDKYLYSVLNYWSDVTGIKIVPGTDMHGKPIQGNRELRIRLTREVLVDSEDNDEETLLAFFSLVCRQVGAKFTRIGPRAWRVDQYPPFSVSFRKADVRGALMAVARAGGLNVVLSSDLPERRTVTVSTTAHYYDDALRSVAEAAGLAVFENHTHRVFLIADPVNWNPSPSTKGKTILVECDAAIEALLRDWEVRIGRIYRRAEGEDSGTKRAFREWRSLTAEISRYRFREPFETFRGKVLVYLTGGEVKKRTAEGRCSSRALEFLSWRKGDEYDGNDIRCVEDFAELMEMLMERENPPSKFELNLFDRCREAFLHSLRRLVTPAGTPGVAIGTFFRIKKSALGIWAENEFIRRVLEEAKPLKDIALSRLEFNDLPIHISGVILASGGRERSAIVNGRSVREGETIRVQRPSRLPAEVILEKIESDKGVRFLYKGVRFRVPLP